MWILISDGFVRSQLIWIYSVFKKKMNPGSAGKEFLCCIDTQSQLTTILKGRQLLKAENIISDQRVFAPMHNM